jgi:hypothetical protein
MDEDLVDYRENDIWNSLVIFFTNEEVQEIWCCSKYFNNVVGYEKLILPLDKERTGGQRLVRSKSIAIQTELCGPYLVLKEHTKINVGFDIGVTSGTNNSPGKGFKTQRKNKGIKARYDRVSMVIGFYVGLDRVETLSDLSLVMKFMNNIVSRSHLICWLETSWRKMLGYILSFHILVKGWIFFLIQFFEIHT